MTQERCEFVCVYVCVCVLVCYKIKRWTLSCLKSLLGVSRALSHVMLLVPLSTTNIHTADARTHTGTCCLCLYQRVNISLQIQFIFFHVKQLRRTPRHHYNSAFAAYFFCVPLQCSNHLSSPFCRASYSTQRKQIATSANG